jgi:hypothetical protein
MLTFEVMKIILLFLIALFLTAWIAPTKFAICEYNNKKLKKQYIIGEMTIRIVESSLANQVTKIVIKKENKHLITSIKEKQKVIRTISN